MTEDPVTGALTPFDFDHLIDNVPKIRKLGYGISHIQFPTPIDSSDINPSHWASIASDIAQNYDRYDGFVVLHGTDTMAYTASALSFMLRGLSKPVIITGSQLPIGEVRTDGEENLITALQIAAEKATDGSPRIKEVAILFENYLWRGNRSTKVSSDDFNAFKSNNFPPLARIGLSIEYLNHPSPAQTQAQLTLMPQMDPSVAIVTVHPGLTQSMLHAQLNLPGLKAVVLRTYGAGNTPTSQWFMDEISQALDRGLVIVNVTQCLSGSVMPNRYVSADRLTRLGVIPGMDLTCEAALTKLMHLLALNLTKEDLKNQLLTPISGEISFSRH